MTSKLEVITESTIYKKAKQLYYYINPRDVMYGSTTISVGGILNFIF